MNDDTAKIKYTLKGASIKRESSGSIEANFIVRIGSQDIALFTERDDISNKVQVKGDLDNPLTLVEPQSVAALVAAKAGIKEIVDRF